MQSTGIEIIISNARSRALQIHGALYHYNNHETIYPKNGLWINTAIASAMKINFDKIYVQKIMSISKPNR